MQGRVSGSPAEIIVVVRSVQSVGIIIPAVADTGGFAVASGRIGPLEMARFRWRPHCMAHNPESGDINATTKIQSALDVLKSCRARAARKA